MSKKKWTYETVKQLSLDCVSRRELRKKSEQAYYVAKCSGWLDDFSWLNKYRENHPECISEPWSKYTFNFCKEESKKYKYISEIRKNNIKLYNRIKANNARKI